MAEELSRGKRSNEPTARSPEKKKRRINPVLILPETQTEALTAPDFLDLPSPDRKLPAIYTPSPRLDVNDIFFGTTELGRQLSHHSSDVRGPTVHHPSDERQFSFFAAKALDTNTLFIAKQVQRFVARPATTYVQRRGKPAAYVLPYRLGTSATPSAVVVSTDSTGKLIATRENVLETQDTIRLSAIEEHGPEDEFSYLLSKYVGREDEDASSTQATVESTYSISDDSDNSESGAEESEDDTSMSAEDLKDGLNEAMEDMREQWRDNKLPKLEQTKARSTWNQMRQSKTLRDELVNRSKSRIVELNRRLDKLLQTFSGTVFRDKDDLKTKVSSIQPTVEDILMQEWQIDVYQRRKKPQAPVPVSYRATISHTASKGVRHPAFELHAGDRLSTSPEFNKKMLSSKPDDFLKQTPRTQKFQAEAGHDTLDDFIVPDIDLPDTPTARILANDINKTISADSSLRAALQSQMSPRLGDVFISSPGEDTMRKMLVTTIGSSPADAARNFTRVPARPKSEHKPANQVVKQKQDDNDPLAMDADQVEREDFVKLEADADHKRILIKLLYDLGANFRDDAFGWFSWPVAGPFWKAFEQAARRLLMSPSSIDPENEMTPVVGLYLAYHYARPTIDLTAYTSDEIRAAIGAEHEKRRWQTFWRDVLKLKDQKLFNKGKQRTRRAERIELSESSDSDMPIAKRQKRQAFKESRDRDTKAAIRSQEAHLRFERAEQASSQVEVSEELAINGSTQGPRIEINNARKKEQPAISINGSIASSIKTHQIDGVRFLWRELTADSDEEIKGALLSHSMGLGKTMQAITVLTALCEAGRSLERAVRDQLPPHLLPKAKEHGLSRLRILILCPSTLITNWQAEITQWDGQKIMGRVFKLDSNVKSALRKAILTDWANSGGVMLTSHDMYRNIVSGSKALGDQAADAQSLMRKTADIVVLDEAQAVKNKNSKLNKAVQEITAKARIALTGTPLSNSIDEIYELISWVSPGYLSGRSEFNQTYAIPIKNGLYSDCTAYEWRKALMKLKILQAEIQPKNQRATVEVLKHDIPPKIEYTLTIGLSQQQRDAYVRMVKEIKEMQDSRDVKHVTVLAWLHTFGSLLAHPSIFRAKLLDSLAVDPKKSTAVKKKKTPANIVRDEAAKQVSANSGMNKMELTVDAVEDEGDATDGDLKDGQSVEAEAEDDQVDAVRASFTPEMVKTIIGGIVDSIDPALGAKTQLTLQIVARAIETGDKVLIFSSSLNTLDFLGAMFQRRGMEFARIDGKIPVADRMSRIEDLKHDHCNILIISTRAGGVGLNMQAANRVVIMDSGFNPSHEEQAIGRAYRLGQRKPVFVYRFVAGGTFEVNLENMQLIKKSMSQRVIDDKNYKRIAKRMLQDWLVVPKAVAAKDINDVLGDDADVLDAILKEQRAQYGDNPEGLLSFVYDISTTLQRNVDALDEDLNDEEQQEVEQTIEIRKTTRYSTRLATKLAGTAATDLTQLS